MENKVMLCGLQIQHVMHWLRGEGRRGAESNEYSGE